MHLWPGLCPGLLVLTALPQTSFLPLPSWGGDGERRGGRKEGKG